MNSIGRRKFLALGGGAVAVAASASAYSGVLNEVVMPSSFQEEVEEVIKAWNNCGYGDPGRYIEQTLLACDKPYSLSDLAQKDYRNHQVLNVKGLILSKIEAAQLLVFSTSI